MRMQAHALFRVMNACVLSFCMLRPAWRGTTRARKHAHTPTRTRPRTHHLRRSPCFSSRHQARYRDAHLVPGASHRRLALAELCRVPNLLRDMQRGERLDLALYAFAKGVYHQRLRQVPAEVLADKRSCSQFIDSLVNGIDPADGAAASVPPYAADDPFAAEAPKPATDGFREQDIPF